MKSQKLVGGAWAVVCIALGGGCGDDSTTADDGGTDEARPEDVAETLEADDGDPDDGGPGDDGGGTGTLDLLVQGRDYWGARTPLAEAIVALDAADGTRQEATTDADGRAHFEGFDWPIDLTAAAEGYVVQSLMGLTETPTLECTLSIAGDPTDGVELSGTALHMTDETHGMQVTATTRTLSTDTDLNGPDWTVRVPPDVPLTLVATEFQWRPTNSPTGRGFTMPGFGWRIVSQDPVAAPTTVDIDFSASPVTPVLVQGSFPLPAAADSVLRANDSYGYIGVTNLSSVLSGWFGYTTATEVSTDGTRVEFDGEYVEPPGVTDPATYYLALQMDTTPQLSRTIVPGYPPDGDQDIELLDPPRLVTPPSPSTRHPLHDPIAWSLSDAGVRVGLVVQDEAGSLWEVLLPEDATTVTIPALPAAVNESDVLGTGVVPARLYAFRTAASGDYLEQYAVGTTFILEL